MIYPHAPISNSLAQIVIKINVSRWFLEVWAGFYVILTKIRVKKGFCAVSSSEKRTTRHLFRPYCSWVLVFVSECLACQHVFDVLHIISSVGGLF